MSAPFSSSPTISTPSSPRCSDQNKQLALALDRWVFQAEQQLITTQQAAADDELRQINAAVDWHDFALVGELAFDGDDVAELPPIVTVQLLRQLARLEAADGGNVAAADAGAAAAADMDMDEDDSADMEMSGRRRRGAGRHRSEQDSRHVCAHVGGGGGARLGGEQTAGVPALRRGDSDRRDGRAHAHRAARSQVHRGAQAKRGEDARARLRRPESGGGQSQAPRAEAQRNVGRRRRRRCATTRRSPEADLLGGLGGSGGGGGGGRAVRLGGGRWRGADGAGRAAGAAAECCHGCVAARRAGAAAAGADAGRLGARLAAAGRLQNAGNAARLAARHAVATDSRFRGTADRAPPVGMPPVPLPVPEAAGDAKRARLEDGSGVAVPSTGAAAASDAANDDDEGDEGGAAVGQVAAVTWAKQVPRCTLRVEATADTQQGGGRLGAGGPDDRAGRPRLADDDGGACEDAALGAAGRHAGEEAEADADANSAGAEGHGVVGGSSILASQEALAVSTKTRGGRRK
jgi:hypothetical protein